MPMTNWNTNTPRNCGIHTMWQLPTVHSRCQTVGRVSCNSRAIWQWHSMEGISWEKPASRHHQWRFPHPSYQRKLGSLNCPRTSHNDKVKLTNKPHALAAWRLRIRSWANFFSLSSRSMPLPRLLVVTLTQVRTRSLAVLQVAILASPTWESPVHLSWLQVWMDH